MKEFEKFFENIKKIIEKNVYPGYMRKRKRSVIVFSDFEYYKKVNKNFEINFFDEKIPNKKIIDIFVSKPYNIILGDREFFKRLSPLEVFFKYRTDIVVPFLVDDIEEISFYRSAFNSYVYPENPYIERFYFMDYKGNCFVKKGFLKNLETFLNLYSYQDNDFKMFFIKKGECDRFEIFSYPYYSFDKFTIFETKSAKKYAYPVRCFEIFLEKNVEGVFNVKLIDDKNLKISFYKGTEEKIQESMKVKLKKFFWEKNLLEKNFDYEIKKVF
ncbi:MAG: hypothetical protein ABIM64_03005 [candidate division WOR-3 bacterium]